MTANCTVTVVIPTYNRAHCIKDAIDSVLAQSYQEFEIIVVDDGSTDNTIDVVRDYGDKIKYIRQENRGAAHARNTGISVSNSKGEWIAFLDSDDLWESDKLKIQVNQARIQNTIVAHMVDTVIEYAGYEQESMFQRRGVSLKYENKPLRERPLCDILETQFFTSGWMVKRKIFQYTGLFDTSLRIFEDFNLLTKIALEGPIYVSCYKGVVLRRRPFGVTDLSSLYQKERRESLNSLVKSYSTLKKDPRLNQIEYREVCKRLGGVHCELFDEYLKHHNWRLGFSVLFQSVVENPCARSIFRAGLYLTRTAGLFGRLKKSNRRQSTFRRSYVEQVRSNKK